MLNKRIIPCLDVTAGRVVKGINFVVLQDAGDPVEIAQRYDGQGADELTFLDITATSDGRDLILHIIEDVASQVFIPFEWHFESVFGLLAISTGLIPTTFFRYSIFL